MEIGTTVEILRLTENHAWCGTILRAAVLNPKKNMTLPFNNHACSAKCSKLSARNPSNTTKLHEGLYSWNRQRKVEVMQNDGTDILAKFLKYCTREHRYVREI